MLALTVQPGYSGGHNVPGLQVADPGITVRGAISLRELLALDEPAFRTAFKGTPVMRAKRRGLVRNACVSGQFWRRVHGPSSAPLCADAEPLLRGHCVGAGTVEGVHGGRSLRDRFTVETDMTVA